MTLGTGWVPESAPRRLAGKIATAARTGALLRPESTTPRFDPWVLSQGSYNACTGHNGAGALYEFTGFKGSPWMPWQFGLVHDGADPKERLPNDGVRTSSMLAALRLHGICPHSEWSSRHPFFSPRHIPPALPRAMAQKYNVEAIALYASGQRLVDLIVDGLARGYSGGISVRVDRRFDNAASDPIGPEDGPIAGHHIITLRRAFRWGGNYAIETVNSWGRDHGDGGLVRLSAERVGQSPFAWLLKGVS